MIAPVEEIVRRARKVRAAARECAVSDEAYLHRCCDKLEADAHAAMETAEHGPHPSPEALGAAKAQEKETCARADNIREKLLKIYDERAEIRRQREGLRFWEKKRVGEVLDERLEKLGAEEHQLDAAARIAERAHLAAMAATVRAEKAHFVAAGEAARETAQSATKHERVRAVVSVIRELVHRWPGFVRLGPSACFKLGQEIAQKKRELMNPDAKTIWGIPLAWDP